MAKVISSFRSGQKFQSASFMLQDACYSRPSTLFSQESFVGMDVKQCVHQRDPVPHAPNVHPTLIQALSSCSVALVGPCAPVYIHNFSPSSLYSSSLRFPGPACTMCRSPRPHTHLHLLGTAHQDICPYLDAGLVSSINKLRLEGCLFVCFCLLCDPIFFKAEV